MATGIRTRLGLVCQIGMVTAFSTMAGCMVADQTSQALGDTELSEEDEEFFFPIESSGIPIHFDATIGDKVITPEMAVRPADAATPKALLLKSAQSNAETYRWSAPADTAGYGEWDVVMKPVQTHICYLTSISGDLHSQGSAVVVHRSTEDVMAMATWYGTFNIGGGTVINESGPNWKLGGFQQHGGNSLTGEATCVPLADFTVEPGGIKQLSSDGWARVDGCASTSVRFWDHAATFMTGIQGGFYGGGEYASKVNGAVGTANWGRRDLKVRSEKCTAKGFVEAHARSLFLGSTTIPGESTTYSNFSVTATSGKSKDIKLSRTDSAICYLTHISGAIDGAGESIRIYPKKEGGIESWHIAVKASGGSAYAKVTCTLYDQRPAIVE